MAVNPIEDYVLIEYQSAYGTHLMTRPTKNWTGTPWANAGSFATWDDSVIPAETMVVALIDKFLPLFAPDVTFTGYTIYQWRPDTESHVPVWSANLTGKVGTSTDETQSRAWERTYTFRTSDAHIAKICLLDVPCGGLVSRYNSVGSMTPDHALIVEFIDETNGWSGRANERPVFFKTLTTQPNAALEHKYGVN